MSEHTEKYTYYHTLSLHDALPIYRLDPPLQKYLIHKSDFGRKGHPIWKVLLEMSTMGPRLQSPPAYLLSQLKKFEV